jgi:hypothetical protein
MPHDIEPPRCVLVDLMAVTPFALAVIGYVLSFNRPEIWQQYLLRVAAVLGFALSIGMFCRWELARQFYLLCLKLCLCPACLMAGIQLLALIGLQPPKADHSPLQLLAMEMIRIVALFGWICYLQEPEVQAEFQRKSAQVTRESDVRTDP